MSKPTKEIITKWLDFASVKDINIEDEWSIKQAIRRLIEKSKVTINKNNLSGWLFGFMIGNINSLRENRRFYSSDNDVNKLKQIYYLIENQPEVDEAYRQEIIMFIRHEPEIMEKWRKYQGFQTFVEFVIECLKSFQDAGAGLRIIEGKEKP